MNQIYAYKKFIFAILLFIFTIFIIKFSNLTKIDYIDFSQSNSLNSSSIVGELIKDTIVTEKIIVPYSNLKGISIQFANFSNRINLGTVNINLYAGNTLINAISYDANSIGDGEYITIPINYNINIGEELIIKIFSEDGKSGSSVTCFTSDNSILDKLGNVLYINDAPTGKHLNLKYLYQSNKLNFSIILMLFMILSLIFVAIENKYHYLSKRRHDIYLYIILFVTAFVLFILRDLSFITTPNLYCEDGLYISNLLNDSFFGSAFSTRYKGGNDFQNTGSYILLWIALKINGYIHGYNLTYLPVYIGIISNIFLSFIAIVGYYVFKHLNKFLSIIIYISIILISMGSSGAELFGRILNTPFIWPVLISFLLLRTLVSPSVSLLYFYFTGILCMIGGLSFPICYGIVGIYLIFSLFTLRKNNPNLIWIKKNIFIIFSLAIGIYLFPTIIKSQGAATTFNLTPSSIIEFIFARHFLYPIIQMFYNHLNDTITILLFIFYVFIIFFSLYKTRKHIQHFQFLLLLIFFTFGSNFASAIMRIKMTELFKNYTTTFPDRYYYGCNILSITLLICSVFFIIKYSEIKVKYFYIISLIMLFLTINNKFLFEGTEPYFSIYGKEAPGTFKDCVEKSTNEITSFSVDTPIIVGTYYDFDIWKIELPLSYTISTLVN